MPELVSGAQQFSGGSGLHWGNVNTSTVYSYLVQRNSISPELFYFSKPGLYQIFPQLLNSSINVVCYLFFWHVFISWKTSTLCLKLGMSCWIPFRILLNLEVNQITLFYYKHIRLGFHMRCCMGEWAQSTPAGATALFMQGDGMKGFWKMLLMASGLICTTIEPPNCFKFLPTSLVFSSDKLWAQVMTQLIRRLCWLETHEVEVFLDSLYMFLAFTMRP